jgi:branched-chain amino acid transport system permease protein
MVRIVSLAVALCLAALAVPGDAAAQETPPAIDQAVDICHGLLPGFVEWPRELTTTIQPGSAETPTGVALTWSGDATDAAAGSGSILCWFLPLAETDGAWQIGRVDSSKYGTLTRYDVQQLYKLLRLRPADPGRQKVDRSAPLMPWLYLLQQTINALSLGGLYALIAVGFTLIYASGRVINFAFGEIFMIGAFLALFGYLLHRGDGAGAIVALLTPVVVVAVSGAAGWTMHRLVFRRLAGSGLLPPLIAAIGLSIVLREAVRLLQGPKTRWLPPLEGWSWPLVSGRGFDVYVSGGHLVIILSTALAALALWQIGRATRVGRSFRAATEDAMAAALMGVPVERLFGGAFALGAALAGSAGGFAAWHYGPVDFHMGAAVGLKALTGAIVGGIGSVPGAFAGGLAVAAVEVGAATLVGGAWRDIAVFGLLVLFLVFRPHGLFGKAYDPFRRAGLAGGGESRSPAAR